jgi:hypothetical protein
VALMAWVAAVDSAVRHLAGYVLSFVPPLLLIIGLPPSPEPPRALGWYKWVGLRRRCRTLVGQ